MATRLAALLLGGLGVIAGPALPAWPAVAAAAETEVVNPRLDDPEAIAEGRRFYRTRCVICHGRSGGRGPNLFAGRLDVAAFVQTVINGRGAMPALGARMSVYDVFAVHAYVHSTDHHE